MAIPKGNLVTPVAYRSDGAIRAFELDDDDHLLVNAGFTNDFDLISITQILSSGQALNNEVVIYTAGAGKTGFIDLLQIDNQNTAAAMAASNIRVYNAVPALVTTFLASTNAGVGQFTSVPFPKPLILIAGWSIRVFSPLAGFYARCTIHGFEV